MFAFVVLLIVIGACFYFYQKITALEQEVRAELARAKAAAVPPPAPAATEVKAPVVKEAKTVVAETAEPTVKKETTAAEKDLIAAIGAEIKKKPGMKQPELYKIFADTHRKQLQRAVKEMAETGQLKREKQGNTFLLYPA